MPPLMVRPSDSLICGVSLLSTLSSNNATSLATVWLESVAMSDGDTSISVGRSAFRMFSREREYKAFAVASLESKSMDVGGSSITPVILLSSQCTKISNRSQRGMRPCGGTENGA